MRGQNTKLPQWFPTEYLFSSILIKYHNFDDFNEFARNGALLIFVFWRGTLLNDDNGKVFLVPKRALLISEKK